MLRYWCPRGGRLVLLFIIATSISGCTTTSEQVPAFHSGRQERPSGIVDRLIDSFSERECNVGRFTCPYGLGSAGEPCDCVGPGNVVFKGYTIK
jgi:hypothetical protein